MSHDLQGPLREMVTMTRLLREEHSQALPEDASTLVGFVAQAAERMNVMINDLLHYAQIAQHVRLPNKMEVSERGCQYLLGNVVRRQAEPDRSD
jgi:light-regulated signal transduction histidine kinase (bacteriophytochrome)